MLTLAFYNDTYTHACDTDLPVEKMEPAVYATKAFWKIPTDILSLRWKGKWLPFHTTIAQQLKTGLIVKWHNF